MSRTEQDLKEEQWERMQNPHLFGGTGGGGYRKVKVRAWTTFHKDGNKMVPFIVLSNIPLLAEDKIGVIYSHGVSRIVLQTAS